MSKLELRWTRAIFILAIAIVIAFTAGGIWPFLVVGIIGMLAGFVFGHVSGLHDGEAIAFEFLFGDDIKQVYKEHVESRLHKTAEERNVGVDELLGLIEQFQDYAIGASPKTTKPKMGRVRRETMKELDRIRKSGLN